MASLHNDILSATMLRCIRLLLPVLLAMPPGALAAGYDRQQPVHLSADRIDVDQKKGLSLYRGHVIFSQGTLRLTAARANVQNRANEIETVTAEGKPVTFRHRPVGLAEFINGEASRAVYHAPARRVDLYGNVLVKRGHDVIRSGVLHYDIGNRSVIAESAGGRRVYVAMMPRTSELPAPGDKP